MSKRVDLRKPPNGQRTPRRDARATRAEVLKMRSQAKAQRRAEPAPPPAPLQLHNRLKPGQTPDAAVANQGKRALRLTFRRTTTILTIGAVAFRTSAVWEGL